jgi:hypothetical protein
MWLWLTRKALAATFPSTDQLPGLDRHDPTAALRHMVREAPLTIRAALFASVAVFHLSPLVTIGVPMPAFWLPAGLCDRHAYRLASHRIYLLRQTVLMLKTVGGLVWGALPAVRGGYGMGILPPDPGTFRGVDLPETARPAVPAAPQPVAERP